MQAAKVPVIENGQLVNYLIGRLPIRDFPESNGHGRAAKESGPAVGTLILQPNQSLSPEELKKKLVDLARDAVSAASTIAAALEISACFAACTSGRP